MTHFSRLSTCIICANMHYYHVRFCATMRAMSIEKVDEIISDVLPGLDGWCTVEKGKRMARLVVEKGPGVRCCELGVFGGRSLVCLALPITHCLNGLGEVHGIDPFTKDAALEGSNSKVNDEWWAKINYKDVLNKCMGTIGRLGLSHVRLLLERSQDAVGKFEDRSIDILHADSNHSAEVSTREVELWTPKMKPGGYWIADDVDWETTRPAQQLLADKGFTLVEHHKTWMICQASR